MKRAVLFSAMGVLAASGTLAHAQEIGKVLSSTPVIQQVQVPRQVCTNQIVGGGPSTGTGAVVGGVAGGALGNAISSGSGSGRAAATVLGLVGGALLGNGIEASNNQPRNVQRCTTQTFLENRTTAYNVRYEYAGRQYDVQMPYDPGPTIRLQVTPMAGQVNSAPPQQGGVITAPPLQDNSVAPMPPMSGPSVQAQPIYQVQTAETPTYLQSPDGYPPAQGVVSSTTTYYPDYAYYSSAPYYGSYYPWFPPVALSLGFGYWGGWGGGHGGHWGGHGGFRGHGGGFRR